MQTTDKTILDSDFLENYENVPRVIKNHIDHLGLDYTTCENITNGGLRCSQSFNFSTPIPGKSNQKYTKSCQNYCIDNCEKWVLDLLFSVPSYAIFKNVVDNNVMKKVKVHCIRLASLENGERKASYTYSDGILDFRTTPNKITQDDEKWFQLIMENYNEICHNNNFDNLDFHSCPLNKHDVFKYLCAGVSELREEFQYYIFRSPVYLRNLLNGEDFSHVSKSSNVLVQLCTDLKTPTRVFSIELFVENYQPGYELVEFQDANGNELPGWKNRAFVQSLFPGSLTTFYGRDTSKSAKEN